MKKYFAFRKNTGGFHARTRLGCYLFSCTAVAAALLLAGAELSGKITMGLTAACRKNRRTSVQPVDLEGWPGIWRDISTLLTGQAEQRRAMARHRGKRILEAGRRKTRLI